MTDMGRPALGEEGRTVKAYLKITAQEERALVAGYGSSGKGLRVALDRLLGPVGHISADLRPPLDVVAHERTAHPAIEDDDIEITAVLAGPNPQHYVMDEASDLQVAAALDQVKQSLPIGAEPHRHKRGTPLSTTYVQGQMVRSFTCAVDGCTVVLHS